MSIESSQWSVPAGDTYGEELWRYIHMWSEDPQLYVETFLPSRTPRTWTPQSQLFSEWASICNPWNLAESTRELAKAFKELVSGFPENRRPTFEFPYRKSKMRYPFRLLEDCSRNSIPSMVVSIPGGKVRTGPDGRYDWRQVSMFGDVRPTFMDPFRGPGCPRALANYIKQARNLMLANGHLVAFMVGVYNGEYARIVRYDHASVVVSPCLMLCDASHVDILHDFFWRFVHPLDGEPGRVVGSDLTMRPLTSEDVVWTRAQLPTTQADRLDDKQALVEGRRVHVYDDDEKGNSKLRAFILFKPVFVSTNLFSRATMIWLALEDTRTLDGHPAGGSPTKPAKLCVLKEAWRQLKAKYEGLCYEQFSMIPEEERYALQGFICGVDLGERELLLREAALSRNAPGQDDIGLSTESRSNRPTRLRRQATIVGPLSATFSSASSQSAFNILPSITESRPREDHAYPLSVPHLMHQTFSMELINGKESISKERSHTRIVVDTFGRPLRDFTHSKELVVALRDAIMAHRIAYEKAGVLHRDISTDNILIVDPTFDRAFTGLLHDFDCAWWSEPAAPDNGDLTASSSSDYQVSGSERTSSAAAAAASREVNIKAPILQRSEQGDHEISASFSQGTFAFRAYEALVTTCNKRMYYHDLESFFWVSLFVLVITTTRGYWVNASTREDVRSLFYENLSNREAARRKRRWLEIYAGTQFISGPGSLVQLMADFSRLVLQGLPTTGADNTDVGPGPTRLTYDSVLAAFDAAIACDDWQEVEPSVPVSVWEDDADFEFELSSRESSRAPSPMEHLSQAPKRKYEEDEASPTSEDDTPSLEAEEREAKRCKRDM
ncbi:hypothetical protein C8Q77DRAFT_1103043 [Trametes polyzona]|nr:hypothetical protein C8Q77DRAFT_1103043 [Trametes polyzona]